MLIDKRSTFARELSIPAAGGPDKFGESLPLDVRSDLGQGENLYMIVNVPVAAAGGTSVYLELVTANNEALTSSTVVMPLGTFLTAGMTVGALLYAGPIPSAFYNTFVGLRATVVGTFSAGKLNAFLSDQPIGWRTYADGNS